MERAVPPELVIWGEVGLAGEVRAVGNPVLRAAESLRLGFATQLLPAGNLEQVGHLEGIDSLAARSVAELADLLFASRG